MKTKKSKRANLENLRTIFLQIGFILTLSFILVAFEWKSNVDYNLDYVITTVYDDLGILPPVTMPKAELPKKVEAPVFEIKPDDYEVPDEPLDLFDPEIGVNEPFIIPDYGNTEEPVDDNEYVKVEIMPTFMGEDALYFRNYIINNLKFPVNAIEYGIKGRVYVSFVVDKDGSITKVEVTRSVHPVIDKAVVDVIKNSPDWSPGLQSGKYVKVKFSITIAFELK
ncbi:MAG: TonB family protein [Bacteroidales bacterium]|nr:TonB family protein [Bacteroidales bacterium]